MKQKPLGLLLAVVFLAGCASQGTQVANRPPQPSEEPVPALTPYGVWADLPGLGRVWHPNVPFYWKPFTDGQWYWTERGWLWHSDEPFAWIVYHYGYWTQASPLGWVWMPGYDWSPARVVWVFSDDLIGWAPMPPPGRSVAAVYEPNAAGTWVVVAARDFAGGNVLQHAAAAPSPRGDIGAYRTRSNAPDIRFVERRANRRIDTVTLQSESVRNGNRNLTRVLPTAPAGAKKEHQPAGTPLPPAEQPSQPRTTQGSRRTADQPGTQGRTDQKPSPATPETKGTNEGASRQTPRTTQTRTPADTAKTQPAKK